MKVKVIKTDEEYETALAEVERLMDKDPAPGTPNADRLELLALIVRDFEEKNYPVDIPDPIEAINFRMEQMGLTRKDMEKYIGGSGRVSEVLSGKRRLSLSMIRALHSGLGIPVEPLIGSHKAVPLMEAKAAHGG